MLNKLENAMIECDIFSSEVQLRIQNGNSKYKTKFGGLLSFLTFLLIIASLGFFLNQFFGRKESIIIYNSTSTNELNITNYNEYPFMARFSDTNSVTRDDASKIYVFILQYWWAEKNMSDPKQTLVQYRENIPMMPCNIDNPVHFNPKYVDLFRNQTDIYTFLCPEYTKNYSIYGLYGDSKEYSYFHLMARTCNQVSTNCNDLNSVNTYLDNAYFDMRTITHDILPYSTTPYKPTIQGERFPISNSLRIRLWMYIESVAYKSDFGYIFEETQVSEFFKIRNFNKDIFINAPGTVPFTFFGITLLNYKEKSHYTRTYMKAQTFLANVGGIIRGLTLIGYILNFIISEKLFNLYLINHIPEIRYLIHQEEKNDLKNLSEKNKVQQNLSLGIQENNFIKQNQNEMFKKYLSSNNNDNNNNNRIRNINNNLNTRTEENLNNINNNNNDNNNNNNNNINNNNNFNYLKLKKIDFDILKKNNNDIMTLNNFNLALPNFLYCGKSKDINTYQKTLDYLNEELDMAMLINKVNQIEKIKNCLMNDDQILVFNYIYQAKEFSENFVINKADNLSKSNNITDYEDFTKSYQKINEKELKDNIDNFLMKLFS